MQIKLTKDRRNSKRPWVVRFSDSPDFETGKTKWRSKAFRYKLDAQNFKTELLNGEIPEIKNQTNDMTISEFRQEWIETLTGRYEPSTMDNYRGTFDRLEIFFGQHRPLSDITQQQAEKFIMQADYRGIGHKTKNELAESSRKKLLVTSKAIFNKAIRWDYLKSNPFQNIDLPEPAGQRFHKFTPTEEKALIEAAPTLWHKTFYDVMLTTGARLSEVLSRTWADFDFSHEKMIICDRRGRPDLPPFRLKTKKGKSKKREVPLSPGTIALLTALQAAAPEGVPYVFLTQKRYELVIKRWNAIDQKDKLWQNRWLSNNLLNRFKKHCRKAGIKPRGQLCLHTLRKNTGQNLADEGLPLNVVQKILGHSRAETTITYYSQVDPHHLDQVRQVVEKRRSENIGKDVQSTYRPDLDKSKVKD